MSKMPAHADLHAQPRLFARPSPWPFPASWLCAIASLLLLPAGAQALDCSQLGVYLRSQCEHSVAAWERGQSEVYLSGYAHHDRRTYDADRIADLNERAWGLGLARSAEDAERHVHSIYVLAFRDSHFKAQIVAGYKWQAYWRPTEHWRVGGGVTVFLFSRSDIANHMPVPFALPVVSLGYRSVTLYGTFIPKVSGAAGGNGNVGYVFTGVRF